MPIKVGTFDLDPAQTTISVSGVGFQPKAIYFVGSSDEIDDFPYPTAYPVQIMRGVATTSGQMAVCNTFGYPSARGGGKSVEHCICYTTQLSPSGTYDYLAKVSSFDADGFTLSGIITDGYQFYNRRVNYMAFGGADNIKTNIQERQIEINSTTTFLYPALNWDMHMVFSNGGRVSGNHPGHDYLGGHACDGISALNADAGNRGSTQGSISIGYTQPSGFEDVLVRRGMNSAQAQRFIVPTAGGAVASAAALTWKPDTLSAQYITGGITPYQVIEFDMIGFHANRLLVSGPTTPGRQGYNLGTNGRPDAIIAYSPYISFTLGPSNTKASGVLHMIGMTDGVNNACMDSRSFFFSTGDAQYNSTDSFIKVWGTTDLVEVSPGVYEWVSTVKSRAEVVEFTSSGLVLDWTCVSGHGTGTDTITYFLFAIKEKKNSSVSPQSYLTGRV